MEPSRTDDIAGRYARFADHEAKAHSAVYSDWAARVADDPEVLSQIEQLPPDKRQPNLVFASARLAGARPGPYQGLREVLLNRWDAVRTEALARSTQTNEAARMAVLMPVWSRLAADHGPLALLELGASAGLCLHPQSWRYRYVDRAGSVLREFGTGPALEVVVKSTTVPALPTSVPEIGHRTGLDLVPLDPTNPADADWLRTLVWPGQQHRLDRLDQALQMATTDPVEVVRADLRDPNTLASLLADVPEGLTPVVFHTAVLAYLDEHDRASVEHHLTALASEGACHWISVEGREVLPGVRRKIRADDAFEQSLRKASFVVAVDGVPAYQADGHAGWIL